MGKTFIFSSESVTEGHPDKVCDTVSDAVLDACLTQDPSSRVACETLVTTGLAMVAGEITTSGDYVDIPSIVRKTINGIGYDRESFGFDGNTCGVMVAIDEQSVDIAQGVDDSEETRAGSAEDDLDKQGAGDQGMMFGYACKETNNYMPLALEISHLLLKEMAAIRKAGKEMTYLRPDSKSQVTIEYDDKHKPMRIDAIVLSTQHDDFVKAKGGSKTAKPPPTRKCSPVLRRI